MLKSAIAASLLLLLSISIQAQRRTFDNFDTSAGVKVIKPAPPEGEEEAVTTTVNGKAYSTNVSRISMSSSRSLRGFTTGDAKVDSYILTSSKKHRIDPLLIYAQMHQESAFKKKARSHKGASGLMQLMPATARRFGVQNIYDPKQNIEAGVKYMRWLIDKFNGDVVLALAGYNAGEGAVMKYGWNIPPYRETREYVKRIAKRYNSITDGNVRKNAQEIDEEEAKKVDEQEAVDLKLYEPNILTVKLPNGKMRLVSQ